MNTRTDLAKREATASTKANGSRQMQSPPIDLYENADELLLLADMPGATPDDVAIHVDRDELTIETRHSRPNLEDATARQESDIVEYRRSFTVPHGLDVDKIKAEVSNGVLALHLPKSPAIKPRQIQVRAG
jgi:HSP20 family protein